MKSQPCGLTVYYDGSCPLCSAEINLYRTQDVEGTVSFCDVSDVKTPLDPDLSRAQAMKWFHVRNADGSLVSGARAFVSLWAQLPGWKWAARIAAFPVMMLFLEAAYRLFLPARPLIVRSYRLFRSAR